MDIKDLIAGYLFNDETKKKIIDKLNDKVDVPFINEKTEQKVFESLWDIVETCIREQLYKELA